MKQILLSLIGPLKFSLAQNRGSCEDEWYVYYYALPLLIVLTVLIVLFCVNCINCIIVINCTDCIISWEGGKPPPQTPPTRVPLFYILAKIVLFAINIVDVKLVFTCRHTLI